MNVAPNEDLFCREGLSGPVYYKDKWEKIEDNHYGECPVSIAASHKRISTLCLCDKIEIANKSAEDCQRCHQFPEFCKCGPKAQF